MFTATEAIAQFKAHSIKPVDGNYIAVIHPKTLMLIIEMEFQGFKYRRKAARLALLASPTIARIYKP